MFLWLNRSPESFLRDLPPNARAAHLPRVGPDRILRWNVAALYKAMDAQRLALGLTWKQASAEILRQGIDRVRLHVAVHVEVGRRQYALLYPTPTQQQIGIYEAQLATIRKGGLIGFPDLMKVVQWLNQPAVDFTFASER